MRSRTSSSLEQLMIGFVGGRLDHPSQVAGPMPIVLRSETRTDLAARTRPSIGLKLAPHQLISYRLTAQGKAGRVPQALSSSTLVGSVTYKLILRHLARIASVRVAARPFRV